MELKNTGVEFKNTLKTFEMKNEDRKAKLVIQYHAICVISGTNESMQRRIKDSYGVKHINELAEEKIIKVIAELQRIPDMWRKRVIAAIFGWLSLTGQSSNIEMVKAIACRSASHDDFNQIPVPRLRDVYNEFCKKEKINSNASALKSILVAKIAVQN
jgi:hypothetical protein